MAYAKQNPSTGDVITQVLLRTMETQYEEAKTELETAGGGDIAIKSAPAARLYGYQNLGGAL